MTVTTTKRCARCRESRPREAFGSNSARTDGLNIYCRECFRAVMLPIERRRRARRKAASMGHLHRGYL